MRKPAKKTTRKKAAPRPPASAPKKTAPKTITPSRKPKFKLGEFVYSPQNRTEKRQISGFRFSKRKSAAYKYRLTLSNHAGMPVYSRWFYEYKLRKTKP